MDATRLTIQVEREPVFRMPEWRTPIIGRSAERSTLAGLLNRDDVWLVTITGPGGVGKSRLAHAVARDLHDDYQGNVAWVSLASAHDRDRATEHIASALGGASVALSAEDALIELLRHRRALLVLDNLEQIPDLAPLLVTLADELPGLTLLATSRVPMHLRGERDFALGPLPAPAPVSGASLENLRDSPGVQLFVNRAEAADSNFALTESNAWAVSEICSRLDGLPLAIELAAARVRLLAPEMMVPRLTRSLDLLTAGPKDAPERHQTLRNTIQWSYDLLSTESQRVFRQLSVFPGTFDLEAAQAVTGNQSDVLDQLAVLLDHSLLVRLDHPLAGRFVMLDTIREFAASALGQGVELQHARSLHAGHYARLVEPTVLRPAQDSQWLDLVDREMTNLRDALIWLETDGDDSDFLKLVNALSNWWLSRGNLKEGYDWLKRALSRVASVASSLRLDTQINTAWVATQFGDFEYAKSIIDEIDMDALAQEPIRPRMRYFSLQGAWHFLRQDIERAFFFIDQARQLAEAESLIANVPSIRINLGAIAAVRGDVEESRRQHMLGLEESTDIDIRAIHACDLAGIATRGGDYPSAWTYLQQAWSDARSIGSVHLMVSIMANKAELLASTGYGAEAALLLGAADEFRQSRGWSISAYGEDEYQALIDLVKKHVPAGEFDAAEARGRALSADEIDALMALEPVIPESSNDNRIVETSGSRGLTAREMEVLQHLVQGKTNPEIAEVLFISERTVQTHVARILQKLDVPSRGAAAVIAVREGLVS